MRLSLVVLRSPDVDATRRFYEALGLVFAEERHGDGPRHVAARLGDAVLEIDPGSADQRGVTFGIGVPELAASGAAAVAAGAVPVRSEQDLVVLRDPDGRTLILQRATAAG